MSTNKAAAPWWRVRAQSAAAMLTGMTLVGGIVGALAVPTFAASARAGAAATVACPETSTTPTADPTASAWSGAAKTPETIVAAGSMPAGFAASFICLWDSKNLYLMNVVTDPSVHPYSVASGRYPWYNDTMEIYLDPNNAGSTTQGVSAPLVQLIVPVTATSNSDIADYGAKLSGVTFTTKTVTNGYDVLVTIPWSALSFSARAGQYLGADIGADAYGATAENQVIAWKGSGTASEQIPASWGQLELTASGSGTQSSTAKSSASGSTSSGSSTVPKTGNGNVMYVLGGLMVLAGALGFRLRGRKA